MKVSLSLLYVIWLDLWKRRAMQRLLHELDVEIKQLLRTGEKDLPDTMGSKVILQLGA